MRLVEYATAGGPRAGVLQDGRVFGVRDAAEGGLQALLGRLDSVEPEGEGVPLEEVGCRRRSRGRARSSASG
jgi:hypothetical protein